MCMNTNSNLRTLKIHIRGGWSQRRSLAANKIKKGVLKVLLDKMFVTKLNLVFIVGLVIIGHCSFVLSKPSDVSNQDAMQADDYDYYVDDHSGSSQQNKSPQISGPAPYFPNPNITVIGPIGTDIVLKCDARNLKDNVILWYYNENVISTGSNVISPKYSIDANFALTLIAADKRSEGNYYCEITPQKIRMRTKVIVADVYATTSESSTSGQEITRRFHWLYLMLTVGCLALYDRVGHVV